MIAFLNTNILIYAQGTGAKSEVARQTILAGGVISVQVPERVCFRPSPQVRP